MITSNDIIVKIRTSRRIL